MSKNIKSRENAEKKQKIKNIIFKVIHGISYVCTGLFVAVCIVSCATSQRKQANAEIYPSEIQYRIDDVSETETSSEVSYPIYDDTLKKIILNPTIASTYSLENFYQWTLDNLNNDSVEIIYQFVATGPATFAFNSLTNTQGTYKWSFNGCNLIFLYDNTAENALVTDDLTNYSFYYQEPQSGMLYYDALIYNLTIQCYGDNNYNAVKTAIQADIQANEQGDDINVSIFDGITQSITSFIGTLNSGLTAIIGIFWNSTTSALTPLGILTALVVGVAITYFIFRLIMGLIRLRG